MRANFNDRTKVDEKIAAKGQFGDLGTHFSNWLLGAICGGR